MQLIRNIPELLTYLVYSQQRIAKQIQVNESVFWCFFSHTWFRQWKYIVNEFQQNVHNKSIIIVLPERDHLKLLSKKKWENVFVMFCSCTYLHKCDDQNRCCRHKLKCFFVYEEENNSKWNKNVNFGKILNIKFVNKWTKTTDQ